MAPVVFVKWKLFSQKIPIWTHFFYFYASWNFRNFIFILFYFHDIPKSKEYLTENEAKLHIGNFIYSNYVKLLHHIARVITLIFQIIFFHEYGAINIYLDSI